MNFIRQITEGLRIYSRRHKKFNSYEGNAVSICKQVAEACWNGKFFQTSTGHFNQFYSRDFGMCSGSLLKMGFAQQVKLTLKYAMNSFNKEDVISTHITPKGKAVNFPNYTPESLAYILHTLNLLDEGVVYGEFLEKQASIAFKTINPDSGLIKKNKNYSTMKDHAIRISPIYLNCMIGMISDRLNMLHLNNPFKDYNYKKIIKENFWNGSYFVDDLSGKDYIAGDANTFPFWTGIFSEKNMFKKCFNSIRNEGLDSPIPLRYTMKKQKTLLIPSILTPNYEGNTVWMHLGGCFLETVKRLLPNELPQYKKDVASVIERYKTFPEVLNQSLSPYKSRFYSCDEGMLWSAMYYTILRS